MANLLKTLKAIPKNLPHGTMPERSGFKGVLIDKGERFGAAFAYGAAKGYYGERFIWRGHGLDAWTGAGALLVGSFLNAATGGHSALAPHLERIGDAGVMSALGSLGAAWGMERAGRAVHVLAPGKNAAAPGLPKKSTVLGYIPQAMGGSYLTADEIARYASRR